MSDLNVVLAEIDRIRIALALLAAAHTLLSVTVLCLWWKHRPRGDA